MKMTSHRPRSDSTKAAARAHQNAAQPPLEPPAYVTLPDECRPFWRAVVASRSRDLWTETDLVQAANLARVQYALQRAEVGSDEHAKLSRLSMALARAIAVHPTATAGRAADQAGANAVERDARQEHDDLIPTRRPQMFVV
jgi:hypothetical protein